jgi:NADH dehydrogenase/NADH:ubiquinone oxidoreductase subunit G
MIDAGSKSTATSMRAVAVTAAAELAETAGGALNTDARAGAFRVTKILPARCA